MGKLTGKTALITGGTSGIVLATARLFLREGARVIINGRSPDRVARVLSDLPAGTIGVAGRVEEIADIDRLMDTAKREFGSLDILVLCAGVSKLAPLDKATEADFEEIFSVNVKGAFFCVQRAAPLLRQGGSVILISSGAAELGRIGRGLYAASKAATRQLARSLAAELMHLGVRVNAVSPGPILTPLNIPPGKSPEEQAAVLAKMVPMGRVGLPEDVANSILFLVSPEASFITGAELPVDGGWVQLHDIPPKPIAK